MARQQRVALPRAQWPVMKAPRPLVRYAFLIELLVIAWAASTFVGHPPTLHSSLVAGFVLVVAVVFEECVTRATRLQFRLSSDLKREMTSVWGVAGTVALPTSTTMLLLTAVLAYTWFRQQRPAGQPLYRKCFNAAAALMSCLGAAAIVDSLSHTWSGAPRVASGAITVLVVIAVYTIINRVVVTGALMTLGVSWRDMIGSRDDNLIELATLCLGGLVALAMTNEPGLVILVLLPMVALQRGALVRELEAAAMTDAKTGLLNAVAWEQLATREIARADRESYALAVLIIDIDRFKNVNDRFGHLVGDKVLKGIGRSLTTSLREYDGLGRFGGEEFVAVLPEADELAAIEIAERVRARINQLAVAHLVDGIDESAERLSVSVGVACMRVDGIELADLLHAADQALYRAKSNGRNQVQLAHRGGGIPEQATV